jgi:hypothetical protein
VQPRITIRIVIAAVLAILTVGNAAACSGSDGQPSPADVKTGRVYPMTQSEQKLAASETNGTTSILIYDGLWPTAKVMRTSGTVLRPVHQWRAIFTRCKLWPSDAERDQCNKFTGAGTFNNPRIERDMVSGPEFKDYTPKYVNGKVVDMGRKFTLYASDPGGQHVSCTSLVKPHAGMVLDMLTIGQQYKNSNPGTYSYAPTGTKEFTCTVAA